jgi:hypothetical protein
MFEPLREVLPEDPQALIDDARVLGEKAGRLYGSRSAEAYTALGGVTYSPLRCINEGVVDWGEGSSDAYAEAAPLASSSLGKSCPHKTSSFSSSSSWVSSVLSWLGTAGRSARRHPHRTHHPHQQQRQQHRRRCTSTDCFGLAQTVLAATPHVLPHLLRCIVRVAAFAFPGIRTLCPTAVPDATRLLEARQSRSGGPERATAISFHPLYLLLAVAVDEGAADGSARVVVYDAAAEKVACVLSHAFQKDVNWLQWKPYATDVLAVGCRGGVLVWSLTAGAAAVAAGTAENGLGGCIGGAFGAASGAHFGASARALFYRTQCGFAVTSAAFSNRDGSLLACASMFDTRLHLLTVRQPPFSPLSCVAVVVPSIDGGLREVLFDDDDLFIICAVCEHPSLALIRCTSAASAGASSAAAVHQATVVPIPAPVTCMARATGLGPSLFFLSTKGLEGVLLAKVNPFIGVEVVAVISTGLYRGVGGCVAHFACSRRRLWMQTETNHLVVCRYGQSRRAITVIPVGVAAMEAVTLANFGGCATGSLVAALEQDGTISLIPSYHS